MLAGLATLPAQAHASSAGTALDNYCSPKPTYCDLVVRKPNHDIAFRLRSFVHSGRVKVCVVRRRMVCHTYRFGHDENGTSTLLVLWKRFPYQGRGRYAVGFFSKGRRIGRLLHFTGTPAGR
jgi:hypothetical protein